MKAFKHIISEGRTKALAASLCLYVGVAAFGQDHIEQPVGPPPTTLDYKGKFEPKKIYYIPANPEKGFHWPYYIGTPETVNEKMSLYVEPNNDGKPGAPFETHDYWASIRCEQAMTDYTLALETFAILPVFPWPAMENGNNLYTHALTRAVIEEGSGKLERIDQQLLAMIADAQGKIRDNGYRVPDKVMLWGFSAAGDFVTRMAVIHPERIQCVVAGGLGGFPILPVNEMENTPLNYPVGIADFEQLFGKKFNARAFSAIPMKFFQGGADENDSVAEGDELAHAGTFISDSYSYDQCIFINETFGERPVDRVAEVTAIYKALKGEHFEYIVIPDIEHTTEPFEDQVLAFFKENGSSN